MPLPLVVAVPSVDHFGSSEYDSLVYISPPDYASCVPAEYSFRGDLLEAMKIDKKLAAGKGVHLLQSKSVAGGRLILSSTGLLTRDIDDSRRFCDAARKGIARAKEAGSIKPLVVIDRAAQGREVLDRAVEVALLGCLAELYQPLQAREKLGEKEAEPVEKIGFFSANIDSARVAKVVMAIESGRRFAKDIGGSDCERMTPLQVCKYVQQGFEGTAVKVSVETVPLEAKYPLLSAVTRASLKVERHHPCVIRLEYTGENPQEHLLLAGKGVTYDTGGADLKVGGAMGGMSFDKCGSAAVAGLVKVAAELGANVHILGLMGMVRNSIGSDAYVTDEIIRAHSGVHVKVGNTDAEGRMVLADLLSHLREYAVANNLKNAQIMSIATLTGHAVLAMGPYSTILSNGPAKKTATHTKVFQTSEVWGDPFEVSYIRREDYDFVAPKNATYDILQANDAPSSRTVRGHQFPAAFLDVVSGIQHHGIENEFPLSFSHIDMGGPAAEEMDYKYGKATATPVVALTATFLLPHTK